MVKATEKEKIRNAEGFLQPFPSAASPAGLKDACPLDPGVYII